MHRAAEVAVGEKEREGTDFFKGKDREGEILVVRYGGARVENVFDLGERADVDVFAFGSDNDFVVPLCDGRGGKRRRIVKCDLATDCVAETRGDGRGFEAGAGVDERLGMDGECGRDDLLVFLPRSEGGTGVGVENLGGDSIEFGHALCVLAINAFIAFSSVTDFALFTRGLPNAAA